MKFWHGGYVPIFLGAAIFVAMVIWKKGRSLLGEHIAARSPTIEQFLAKLERRLESRIDGTGVFLSSSRDGVPPSLMHHTRLIPVLPERVILFTLVLDKVPVVPRAERLQIDDLGHGFVRIVAHSGFMETPDVPVLLAEAFVQGNLPIEEGGVTYYLGRETFLATDAGRMGRYSEGLFAFLSRNSRSATAYFHIPPERVVELGTQIDL
jgi:KUP system potassium uptake protein